jgi:hypothetical protein
MEEFIKKVAAMRQAQHDYLKSRDQFNLQAAKRLEAEVDSAIAELTANSNDAQLRNLGNDNHPKLF